MTPRGVIGWTIRTLLGFARRFGSEVGVEAASTFDGG